MASAQWSWRWPRSSPRYHSGAGTGPVELDCVSMWSSRGGLFGSRDMVVEDRRELPLIDVEAQHAADRLHVGETVGGLDEFAQEVLAVADQVRFLLHFQVVLVDVGT